MKKRFSTNEHLTKYEYQEGVKAAEAFETAGPGFVSSSKDGTDEENKEGREEGCTAQAASFKGLPWVGC